MHSKNSHNKPHMNRLQTSRRGSPFSASSSGKRSSPERRRGFAFDLRKMPRARFQTPNSPNRWANDAQTRPTRQNRSTWVREGTGPFTGGFVCRCSCELLNWQLSKRVPSLWSSDSKPGSNFKQERTPIKSTTTTWVLKAGAAL